MAAAGSVGAAAAAAAASLAAAGSTLSSSSPSAAAATAVPYVPVGMTEKRPECTLTSDVHNEAETLFGMLEHKDKKLISFLDCLTILRGMGMNPTLLDMELLAADMKPYILELDELRREEERKKEKEAAKGSKPGASSSSKPDPKASKPDPKSSKPDPKASSKDGSKGATAEGGAEGDKEEKKRPDPSEEVKNIDWEIFITCVEPMYRDNRQEEKEIVAALSVFDTVGRNAITRSDLLKILTENGENVLSPAEVKQFLEAFKDDEVLDHAIFAKKLQGTYVPPPPPSAEELAAKAAEAERLAAEAKKKAEAEDDLLGI